MRNARHALAIPTHGQHAVGNRGGQRTIQYRQPQLAVAPRGAPGDVEPCGMAALASVREHIGPIGVQRVRRHMVRHDIQDQAHALCAHRIGQALQPRLAAQLGIDRGRVDHIVAVH